MGPHLAGARSHVEVRQGAPWRAAPGQVRVRGRLRGRDSVSHHPIPPTDPTDPSTLSHHPAPPPCPTTLSHSTLSLHPPLHPIPPPSPPPYPTTLSHQPYPAYPSTLSHLRPRPSLSFAHGAVPHSRGRSPSPRPPSSAPSSCICALAPPYGLVASVWRSLGACPEERFSLQGSKPGH